LKINNDLEIKKELDTVYIDSSGKKHLNYMDARCAEAQILMCKERKLQQRQRIMETIELIMQVLKSKNWGVYYKIQPIQPLETQDGTALYKVNQVDESEIEKVIEEALAWETQETNPISNQSKNSTTG
jgi:hypothetical protein